MAFGCQLPSIFLYYRKVLPQVRCRRQPGHKSQKATGLPRLPQHSAHVPSLIFVHSALKAYSHISSTQTPASPTRPYWSSASLSWKEFPTGWREPLPFPFPGLSLLPYVRIRCACKNPVQITCFFKRNHVMLFFLKQLIIQPGAWTHSNHLIYVSYINEKEQKSKSMHTNNQQTAEVYFLKNLAWGIFLQVLRRVKYGALLCQCNLGGRGRSLPLRHGVKVRVYLCLTVCHPVS